MCYTCARDTRSTTKEKINGLQVYSKVKDDLDFRREVCTQVGLGFQLPTEIQVENAKLYPNVPKITEAAVVEHVA